MKGEHRVGCQTQRGRRILVWMFFLLCCAAASSTHAQTFSSGSDGSDGIYAPSGPPGTVVMFDPTKFTGTRASANIFNFTTVHIPAGVTVKLSALKITGPVFWLVQGDAVIDGTIDLNGTAGAAQTANAFDRVPSTAGAGGFAGGVGGHGGDGAQAPFPGDGPGGGGIGLSNNGGRGFGGQYSGNQFLIPLVGGSGGGGGLIFTASIFGDGGGAGGGAILIASSSGIVVGGTITASGGAGGPGFSNSGGGGSGGAIRLVANSIAGAGSLQAAGGSSGTSQSAGDKGVVRLEAVTNTFAGSSSGAVGRSTPFPLLLPTAGPSSAKVISINGVPINPNPNVFPDVTINTAAAVPVVIQTHNIPLTAKILLTILDQNAVADSVFEAPPLGNCDQDNVCTTTLNIVFPFGASRGLTKITWTQ